MPGPIDCSTLDWIDCLVTILLEVFTTFDEDVCYLLTVRVVFLAVLLIIVLELRLVLFFCDYLPLSSVWRVLVRTGFMSLEIGSLGFKSYIAAEAFLESGRFLGKFSTGLFLGSMLKVGTGTAVYPTFSGRPGEEPRSIFGILGFVMALARSGSYDPGPMVSSSR